MKPASLVAPLLTTLVTLTGLSGSAAAEITIMDNKKTVEVDCAKDPEVSLLGNHLTVTLKGVCKKLSISGNHETVTGSVTTVSVAGNHNTVMLAAADEIAIIGNDNTVTVARALTRKAPKISNVGTANKITQPK
jgi:hypothetical protein